MKLSRDALKLIALITMTIDHIGYLYFPDILFLRVIGRLAFPIFAYFIAEGFRYTHDVKQYGLRILTFAFITQALFLLVGLDFVNVMFTFAISVAVLWYLKYKDGLARWGIVLMLLAVVSLINSDYSFYGVLMVVLFYYVTDYLKLGVGLFLLTAFFQFFQIQFNVSILLLIFQYWSYNLIFFVQFACLLALPLLAMYNHQRNVYHSAFIAKFWKYLFYWYYPMHLVILKMVGGIL